MKTVMIWDQCGAQPLEFYVFEGDHRELDGTYINDSGSTDQKIDLLNELMSKLDSKGKLPRAYKKFPHKAVLRGYPVIICGFLP